MFNSPAPIFMPQLLTFIPTNKCPCGCGGSQFRSHIHTNQVKRKREKNVGVHVKLINVSPNGVLDSWTHGVDFSQKIKKAHGVDFFFRSKVHLDTAYFT